MNFSRGGGFNQIKPNESLVPQAMNVVSSNDQHNNFTRGGWSGALPFPPGPGRAVRSRHVRGIIMPLPLHPGSLLQQVHVPFPRSRSRRPRARDTARQRAERGTRGVRGAGHARDGGIECGAAGGAPPAACRLVIGARREATRDMMDDRTDAASSLCRTAPHGRTHGTPPCDPP